MALKWIILCTLISLALSTSVEGSKESKNQSKKRDSDQEAQESGINRIISKPPPEFILHPENFNNFEALPFEPMHHFLPNIITVPNTIYGVPEFIINEPDPEPAPAPKPAPKPAPAPAPIPVPVPVPAPVPVPLPVPVPVPAPIPAPALGSLFSGITIDPSAAGIIPKPDILYLLESFINLLGNLVVKTQVAFNNNYEFIRSFISVVINKISFLHTSLLNIIYTVRRTLEFLAALFSSLKAPLASINASIGGIVAPPVVAPVVPPVVPHTEYGVPH